MEQQQQQQQNQQSLSSNCVEKSSSSLPPISQQQTMKEREMLLIRRQRELHNQLKDLYIRQKKLKSEQDALQELNDDDESVVGSLSDFEFEIPSYCSNCLGDILQPPYKSSLSSEYSRKANGDDNEMINLQDDTVVPQLSDHSRLESIKHQILLKLGMKNKPNITDSLPKQYIYDTLRRSGEPVINDFIYHLSSSNEVESENRTSSSKDSESEFQSDGEVDYDDFYGKPREIITFAEMGK